MVVALGPGKFYGSSLPRPRFYTDVKFNAERVDPPVPVMDPLMSWAQEAHWTMGGLSFTRHRLQGRIEGNIKKLRAEQEKLMKKKNPRSPEKNEDVDVDEEDVFSSPSPPPAPVAVKRRRLVDEDEDEDEEEEAEEVEFKRRTVRKLKDDFDKVATRSSPAKASRAEEAVAVAARTRSRRSEEESESQNVVKTGKRRKLVKGKKSGGNVAAMAAANGPRTSPRLAKNRRS